MKKTEKTLILPIGTCMLLFLGLIYAWSIFRAPLGEMFPEWSATQVSLTFTISMVFFCVGGFVAGRLAAKLRHRAITMLSAASILVGFVFIALLLSGDAPGRSLVALYVFYGFFGGGGVGLSYNTLLGVATRHYPGRAGMASGVLLLGFGIGGLALGGLVDFLMGEIGLNLTFLALGCILAAVLFAGSFFVKLPEAGAGERTEAAAPAAEARSFTLSEAVKGPSFWILFVWNIFMSMGGLLVINSAAPIAALFGMIPVIGLVVSVFNGVGRPLVGILLDAIGRRWAMPLNGLVMLCGGATLLLGSLTGHSAFIYIGLPLIGICYGGTPTLLSAVVSRFYGPKHYQVILGAAVFSLVASASIGPLLSSWLLDASGGYTSSFVVIIVAAALSLAFSFLLGVSSRKAGLE